MNLMEAAQTSVQLGTLANWAAATVALISAAIVLWVRWRDRKQADWIAEPRFAGFNTEAGVYELNLRVTNVGDGDAHQVRVVGTNCDVEFRRPDAPSEEYTGHWVVPVVPPSSTVDIYAHTPLVDGHWQDPRSSTVIELQWIGTPTRHRWVRRAYLDFDALVNSEPEKYDGAGLILHEPVWVRWFRSDEYRAARRKREFGREGKQSRLLPGRR